MNHLAVGACWVTAIGACVYLVMHGHPIIGLVVLGLGMTASSKSSS